MALCERLRVLSCLLLSTAVPSRAAVRCGVWCVVYGDCCVLECECTSCIKTQRASGGWDG